MALIPNLLGMLIGTEARKTIQVFREYAEFQAARDHECLSEAMTQYGHEFQYHNRGGFDRWVDALNRLPRPAMAFGVLGLFVAAMVDPVWFSGHVSGLAHVPDPLWWLLGAIVSFYFGARYQTKGAEYRQQIARLNRTQHTPTVPAAGDENAAIRDWADNQ